MCDMRRGASHFFVLPPDLPYGGVDVPLAGEEGKFLEDGPYGRRGSYAALIVPTLLHCVVYHCADVGKWGHT